MSEDEIRKAVAELNLYEAQASSLQRRIELVSSVIAELNITKFTLKEFKSKEANQEFLAPIGANSYIKARLGDISKAIIGIGAGVVIETDVEEAVKKLEEREEELVKASTSLKIQLRQIQSKINEARPQVEELLRKSK
ncbi:MAG: prefoldin subunit alpha [Candidatus Hodarchaeota archaeon]